MEAIGRLAGGVAHDFNNLLTIILGYGAQLANALPPDDTLQSSVTEIQKAGERAASLTKQLLAFSRQQVVQWQILQLNTIIQGMEPMLRRLIGEDIRLSVVLDSALEKIKADRSQIEQIIMNLAVNSRDAMPEGGCLTITTTDFHQSTQSGSLKPGRYAVLTVTDSGQGMDSNTKARVFDPFFTTKELGKGTGLGLSTVYGIVEQIGGQISLESQPGQGATFTIHLPCTAEVEESAAPVPAETGKQDGGRTILLVEDEESVRKLTVTILSKAGYEILATSDGREFLGISTERLETVDLLITDIVMPEISGPDLAARLKACRPGLRVLYISGYSNHPLFARGVQIDTNLLQKPYTPDQLLRTVEAVLAA
jgi:CheY-like chemotaxis protein